MEFANVWEDTDVDLSALAPVPGEHLICVTSGGCTALALLAKGATVSAIDSNPAQNALLELKLGAARALDYNAWKCFLGVDACGNRLHAYGRVRAYLAEQAQAFWRSHLPLIANGVVDQGNMERHLAVARHLYHWLVHPRSRCQRWFELPDLEAQRRFYEEVWDTRRRRAFLALLLNPKLYRWSSHTAAQYLNYDRKTIGTALLSRLERAFTAIRTDNNYFLSRLLLGRFLSRSDGAPYYLRSEAHAALRDAPARLTLHCDDLIRFLEHQPPQSVHGFALSNVVDWLSETEQERLFAAISRAAVPRARICARSVRNSWLPPESCRGSLIEDAARSARLLERERAIVYGTVYTATLR